MATDNAKRKTKAEQFPTGTKVSGYDYHLSRHSGEVVLHNGPWCLIKKADGTEVKVRELQLA